jgi:hypothetical protein
MASETGEDETDSSQYIAVVPLWHPVGDIRLPEGTRSFRLDEAVDKDDDYQS